MTTGRFLRFVMILCLATVSLAGGVLADSGATPPVQGVALGYWSPEQETGHLSFSTAASPPTLSASSYSVGSYQDEVLRLINLERRAAGFVPFKLNPILAAEAEKHSAVMRDQDCFDHQCAGELTSAERACSAGYGPYGWGACYVGETIAAGFPAPAEVVAAWLDSPGHRSLLMSGKLREIGIGYVTGGRYGSYLTADLGSQPDVLPVFVNYDDRVTDSRQVTLTLANEEVSGYGGIDYAPEVMISNDPSFAGAQWEDYTPHKSWTLVGVDGVNTVFVKYRDETSYKVTSSDDILLSGHTSVEKHHRVLLPLVCLQP